jgi:hypothetical protein
MPIATPIPRVHATSARLLAGVLLSVGTMAIPAPGIAGQDRTPSRSRPDSSPLVRTPGPIPEAGALPPMVDPSLARAVALKARAAAYSPANRTLRAIARRHFGSQRVPETRAEGLRLLSTHADAASLFAMPFSLADEGDDVRAVVIAHLKDTGEDGQAALAWTAIHHDDADWRRRATDAITRPASPRVLATLQVGLSASEHETVVRAGRLAGALDARLAIPHLIATQYSADTVRNQGDLGWIAIGTQRSYVANLIPVTGDGTGAFQPVPGIINEGFVMRVQDAVAIVYRTEIHRVLVDMTTTATGTDTSDNGWSLAAWRDWYNREYLPKARAEAARAEDAAAGRDFAEAERRRRELERSDRLD